MLYINGVDVSQPVVPESAADIISSTGAFIGQIKYVTDVASDPTGALAVWDGTEWIGFLRSGRLTDL